jgi:hypothetical protein
MEQDWKTTFNELAKLETVFRSAADKICPLMTDEHYAIIRNNKTPDDLTEMETYKLCKIDLHGPQEAGYEEASRLQLKVLRKSDLSLGIIFSLLPATDQPLTGVNDVAEIHGLSEKYGLKNIQKLLPN